MNMAEFKKVELEEKIYEDEEYEADRVWAAFRAEIQLDLEIFTDSESLINHLNSMFADEPTEGIRGSVGKFGARGRSLLIEQALEQWKEEAEVPEEEKEVEIEKPPAEPRIREKPVEKPLPEERPPRPYPTIPTPYVRPPEIEVTEIPPEEVPEVPRVAPPVVPPVPVPETPAQRIIRRIGDLSRGVARSTSPDVVRKTVSSAGARVRDAVSDAVGWIRDRIRSLGGG